MTSGITCQYLGVEVNELGIVHLPLPEGRSLPETRHGHPVRLSSSSCENVVDVKYQDSNQLPGDPATGTGPLLVEEEEILVMGALGESLGADGLRGFLLPSRRRGVETIEVPPHKKNLAGVRTRKAVRWLP